MWSKVVVFVLPLMAAFAAGGSIDDHDSRVVCYLASWAVYRPDGGRFPIEAIDPRLCTHLIYAFAGLNQTTNEIISLDPQYDINKGAFKRLMELKKINPKLHVSIAIGGWTEGSSKYSAMSATAETRKVFIDSIVKFIRDYGFDGLDLDWEYPANRGGKAEDKQTFVTLCKELRSAMDRNGWLLTAAVGAAKKTIDSAYDVANLIKYVHYLHIMTYDYHGKWESKTGHNAPLYARIDESEEEKTLNVQYTVDYYRSLGAPASKIVLGVGFYGRTFLLADQQQTSMGAPARSTAFAGPYTREDGFLGYNEICEKQQKERGFWSIVWQRGHQAPYMHRGDMWVSYDDAMSLRLKVAYAKTEGLAGMMIWSIDTDDFNNVCKQGKFPLLSAINSALDEYEKDVPLLHPGISGGRPGIINVDVDDDNEVGENRLSNSQKGKQDNGASSNGPAVTSVFTLLLALYCFWQ